MKSIHLKLVERFVIIVATLALLSLLLFLTAINQLKKCSEFNKLSNDVASLSDAKYTIDSLQNELFANLPHNLNFYKTGKSRMVDDFIGFNNDLSIKVNMLANNFFLSGNKNIKVKAFLINQEIKKYNDAIDDYTKLLTQKGFDNFGINGQINLIISNIVSQCKMEGGLDKLADKINTISNLKNQYLLTQDISIINKIRIENEEAKAFVILSNKTQKLIILSKLQKIEELIISLGQLDEAIGVTKVDGVSGIMRTANEQYAINTAELKQMVMTEMSDTVLWGYLWLVFVFIILIVFIYIIYQQLKKFVSKPINKIKLFLSELVQGKLPDTLKFNRNDEIAEMSNNLNKVVEGLKDKAAFALEIGKGKLDSHYEPLSDDDILGNALIDMEISLQKADYEDQKYKNEERKRIWANEGIAKFSEILRQHSNDINLLADEIIQNLVKYLNIAQGGLYFYNDENKDDIHIELIAAFAYDRKKYIQKIIKPGEGLIGTAVVEKEKIFITEIPEDYLTITSGLGDAPPRSILIIPLKLEDEILGVIELASFEVFQTNEIEFVEKVGQTIASTITNVKINARTAKLLEQSQKQAEEMAEQEEEMRQNMEELRTTQEDFARRESEMQGFLNAINNSSLVMVFDESGKITDANDQFLNILNSKREDIVGRQHREFSTLGRTGEDVDRFWEDLKIGKNRTALEKIKLPDGKEVYLRQTFTPILDNKGRLIKVLCISTDITESKNSEKLLANKSDEISKLKKEQQLLSSAIDNALVSCVYSAEGRIINVNERYCQISGHTKSEIIGKISTIYLKEEEKTQFEKIWNEVIKDKPYTGALRRSKPTGEEVWLMASFVPVKDDDENISRVFFLALDITERRLKYQLLEEANKEIDRLRKEKGED